MKPSVLFMPAEVRGVIHALVRKPMDGLLYKHVGTSGSFSLLYTDTKKPILL